MNDLQVKLEQAEKHRDLYQKEGEKRQEALRFELKQEELRIPQTHQEVRILQKEEEYWNLLNH